MAANAGHDSSRAGTRGSSNTKGLRAPSVKENLSRFGGRHERATRRHERVTPIATDKGVGRGNLFACLEVEEGESDEEDSDEHEHEEVPSDVELLDTSFDPFGPLDTDYLDTAMNLDDASSGLPLSSIISHYYLVVSRLGGDAWLNSKDWTATDAFDDECPPPVNPPPTPVPHVYYDSPFYRPSNPTPTEARFGPGSHIDDDEYRSPLCPGVTLPQVEGCTLDPENTPRLWKIMGWVEVNC